MADETYNFDDGTAQGWALTSGTSGTAQVSATAALNSSSYGLEFAWGATNGADNYATKSLASSYSDIYVRFRLNWNLDGQFETTAWLASFSQSSLFNGQMLLLGSNAGSASTWTLEENIGNNTVTLNNDQEYDIEVRLLKDASAGGVQIWVDGTLEVDDLTHDTSGLSDIGWLLFGGFVSNGNAVSGSYIYVDEVEIASSRIGGGGGGTTYNVSAMSHHYAMLRRSQ